MDLNLFILGFTSILGLLMVLYFIHFRHRVRFMGPESLRLALSRTISGDEDCSDEELREGVDQLRGRIRNLTLLTAAALIIILVPCAVLTLRSSLPGLVLSLSGVCVLLVAVMISLSLIRDILKLLDDHLEKEG